MEHTGKKEKKAHLLTNTYVSILHFKTRCSAQQQLTAMIVHPIPDLL